MYLCNFLNICTISKMKNKTKKMYDILFNEFPYDMIFCCDANLSYGSSTVL